MSDIMDEFEFKPLTEGLGFHKKKESKAETKGELKTYPQTTEVQRSVANSTAGLVDLTSPLPRPQNPLTPENHPTTKKNPSHQIPTITVDEILNTLQDKKRPDFAKTVEKTKIDATPEPAKYKKTSWDFSAFLLDFMLILASNLVCLIVLLLTTKVDLFSNLYNPDSSGMIYLSLATLFFGTSWIYMVANRVFIGCTPGEWVFDQRLGLPEETGTSLYTLKIVLRSTILILTGLVILPLVSAFTNRDVLGQWLNLELHKKI